MTEDTEEEIESGTDEKEGKDPNFEPSDGEECINDSDLPKDTKLIVFWSCFLPLLQSCMICHALTSIKRTFLKAA